MELEVADHPEQERFEIHADGELAGFVDYRLHDGELALLHAETLSRFRHRASPGGSSSSASTPPASASWPCCPTARSCAAGSPITPSTPTWSRKTAARTSVCYPRTPRPGRIAAPMSFTARPRFTVGIGTRPMRTQEAKPWIGHHRA